jgi:DNA-binding PadR family transcriptional regulator
MKPVNASILNLSRIERCTLKVLAVHRVSIKAVEVFRMVWDARAYPALEKLEEYGMAVAVNRAGRHKEYCITKMGLELWKVEEDKVVRELDEWYEKWVEEASRKAKGGRI